MKNFVRGKLGVPSATTENRLAFLLELVVVLVCLVVPCRLAAGSDEDGRLAQFLERLGLVELQIVHLEQRLDADPTERLAIARRLADLYAGQLVVTLDDRAQYDEMMRRITRLLDKVPQARTPSLKVMLLQADYYRAEELIRRWLADRKATPARREAAEVLKRIAPQLAQHQEVLSSQVEKLIDEVDLIEDEQLREAKSQELQRVQSVAGRAGYFAAWAMYYRALIAEIADPAGRGFAESRKLFQKLLGIGDDYQELKPEFMALESIWRSMALIGLALAEASAGSQAASDLCFGWLEHASVPPSIKDQVPYWRLQALLNASRHTDALQLARQQVESFSGTDSPSKFSFCVSLVRAGFAGPGTPTLQELGIQGIAGLAKLRRHGAVRHLMAEYGIEPAADSGFYLRWIKGQQLFDRAESIHRAAAATVEEKQIAYQAAAAMLQEALDSPDAKRDLGAAAQCRSQLAWCSYRQGDFERAARLFERASIGLKAAGDRIAVESAWMAFLAYNKLIGKNRQRFVSSAIDVLKQLQRDYPEDDYAKQAGFYIAKLQQNASTPAETLADLEKVRSGAANYLSARYHICFLLHKQSSTAPDDQQIAALNRLASAVNTYLRAAQRDPENSRKAKCCLLVTSAAMKLDPADLKTARLFLAKAQPLVATLTPSASAAAEFHYRALMLARQAGDQARQSEHVRWLVDNGQGSPYERLALGLAAKSIDREITEQGDRPNRELVSRAYHIYGRLAAAVGDSAEQIGSNKNSRVALWKRAHYASLLGRHAEAAEQLERLLAVFSKNKAYIHRAGLAHYQARNYKSSIGHWRTLLSGVSKASDEWFEAKYYQLLCLSHLDLTKFRQVLKQFELLYPRGGSPKWRDRFEELQER